jgi:hypothetical protein
MANLTIDLFDNSTGDLGTFVGYNNFSSYSDFNGDQKYDFIMQYDQGNVAVFFTNNTNWQNLNSSQLNGRNGFTINKELMQNNDFTWYGDLNGDKIDDSLLSDGKKLYLLFGKKGTWEPQIDLSNIASLDNSLVINPENNDSLQFITTVDLDGNDDYNPNDLLLSTSDSDKHYVIFGESLVKAAEINLSNLNSTNGFVIKGTKDKKWDDYAPGDLNNDRINDFVFVDVNKAYVVFGKTAGEEAEVNLSNLNGINGFMINGSFSWDVNINIYDIDFNNDGKNDLILTDSNVFGKYYVVLNQEQWDGNINLANLDGKNGFVINSGAESLSFSNSGDFNGDGKNDLILSGYISGKHYVVFNQEQWDKKIDLVNVDGENGFAITSETESLGFLGLRDFNSDGKEDLLFSNGSGKYTVLFNKSHGWSSSTNIDNLSSEDGFTIFDSNPLYLWSRINLDINNDGIEDLFFQGGGNIYVVFGGNSKSIDLSKLDGSNGFAITNTYNLDNMLIGDYKDINGDNIDDLIFLPFNDSYAPPYKYYVVTGKSTPWQSSIDISELKNSDDLLFIGNQENSNLLRYLGFPIDSNHNLEFFNDQGKLYIIISELDQISLVTKQFPINLSNLNGNNGFVVNTNSNDEPKPVAVTSGDNYWADVNNDNNYDIFLLADGKQYVILSQSTGWEPEINVSDLNGKNGFVITNGNQLVPVSPIPWMTWDNALSILNINNDKYKDFVFYDRSFNADGSIIEGPSKIYIALSKETGWDAEIDLSELDGQNGFVINTQKSTSITSTDQDINGDKINDLVLDDREKTYVIFGNNTSWYAEIDLSQLDGQNGFVIKTKKDQYTSIVSSNQDINGDKINDLVLNDSQNAYVIFGNSEGWNAEIDLANLGDSGFVININDSPDYYYEISVQKFNNDNIADLAVTSDYYSNMASGTYVLFGGPNITNNSTVTVVSNHTLANTEKNLILTGQGNFQGIGNDLPNNIQGNRGNNLIQGMAGDDQLDGRSGNDRVQGGHGNDNMPGGDGDDTLSDILHQPKNIDDTPNTIANNDRLIGGDDQDLLKAGYANDSLYGQEGDDTLHGQLDHDKLLGGASNDVLLGGQGRDQINGNAGDDILTGGASKDKFVFNTNEPFTRESLGVDEITDWQLDMDKIVLDRQTFTELSASSDNILKLDEFAQVTSINQAGTSEAMIVYNTTNGALYYNPNGVATGFGIGGQFAILTNIPELQNTDILIRG